MGGAGATGGKQGHVDDGVRVQTRDDRMGIEDASKLELWRSLGKQSMGQEANAIRYGSEGVGTGDVARDGHSQFAQANEMALAVAAQRNDSEIGTVGTQGPVGELQFKVVVLNEKMVLEVGVPIKMEGIEEPVVVTTTKGVDISSGMGEARQLATRDNGERRSQIDGDYAKQLQKEGQYMSGEQALAAGKDAFDQKRVLGIGGGPTSEWAMEHALNSGASEATVAGAMPRPERYSREGKALHSVEHEIYALVQGNQPVPPELTQKHQAIIEKHVKSQLDEMARLKSQIAQEGITPRAKEQAETALSKIKGDMDPFLNSRLERNENMLNSPELTHLQADVMLVKPGVDEAGKQCIEVFFKDGTSRFVDQIVPSIGADPKAPGGIDSMMARLDPTIQMIPIIHEGRVVGLESNPPGISVSGAALTGSTGLTMPDSLLSRIPVEMRDAVMSSIIDHANREGVTAGSKGIVPGIENVGKNPELARALMDLPPKDRQDALNEFLRSHTEARATSFDGEQRFSDKDLKIKTLSPAVQDVIDKLKATDPQAALAMQVKMDKLFTSVQGHMPPAEFAKDPIAMQGFIEAHLAMRQGTFSEGETVSKVIPMGTVEGMLRNVDRDGEHQDTSRTAGFHGDARNSEDATPKQVIDRLGLDYEGTSYVRSKGEGRDEGVDSLMVLEMPVTAGNKDEFQKYGKIPMDQALVDAIKVLADKGDPKAAELLGHVKVKNAPTKKDAHGNIDKNDPYTGYGTSVHGEMLGTPRERLDVNQETDMSVHTINGPDGNPIKNDKGVAKRFGMEIPDGSSIKVKTASGKQIIVATYVLEMVNGKQVGKFVVNEKLPRGIRDRYQRMIAQGEYTDQTKIDAGVAGGKLTSEQAAEQKRLLDFREETVQSSDSGSTTWSE